MSTNTEKHAALGALLVDIINDAPSTPTAVFADSSRPTDPDESPTPPLPRLTLFETEYQSAHDLLTDRLYQARALSTIVYGCGGESFRQYSDDIQDGVLWALHSLIADAAIAADRLPRGAA